MQRTFQTNLRCGSCVEKIRPLLDAEPTIAQWSVDLQPVVKLLTIDGPPGAAQRANELLAQAGFRLQDEVTAAAPTAEAGPKPSLYPLALVVSYLLAVTLWFEVSHLPWLDERAMRHFMAGFFLVFSFFKLLDLRAFADSYANYDLIAGRWRWYAWVYPFLELALGLAYLTSFQMTATNVTTFVLMLVGAAGVLKSLLAKRTIRCACLGAVFNLPMTYVTLLEDLLMAAMAGMMLWR